MKLFLTVVLIVAFLTLTPPFSLMAIAQNNAEESPQNPSSENPPPATPPDSQAPDPSASQSQTSPKPYPAPDVSKPAHKPSVKRPRAKTKTKVGTQSGKVVVKNGGTRDTSGQISPGISAEQEQHQRETTSQLLATTDANLKKIAGRPMTPAQQSMLQQINTYMKQAKTASDAGDIARAHTLANKAHLLSDELTRK